MDGLVLFGGPDYVALGHSLQEFEVSRLLVGYPSAMG